MNIFEQSKQCGYAIELHFVWISDVREAIRRVRQRVVEGGHDVPAKDIKRRFSRSIHHFLDDYALPAVPLGQLDAASKVVGGIRYSHHC